MMKLHHIALGARDVERVAAFYRQVFGLPERTRYHYEDGALRSIWLDLGAGALLMVEHTEHTKQPAASQSDQSDSDHDSSVQPGPFLLAFAADDTDARERIERQVIAAGYPVESRTQFTAYFRDPEGNRVAVSTYPSPSIEHA